MIIKKYQGKTEQIAIEQAKAELGNGIVIMNVREVKKKGLLAYFSKPLVEVTVALEDDRERYRPYENAANNNINAGMAQSEPKQAKTVRETAPEQSAKDSDIGAKETTESRLIEEKLESLQNLIEQQIIKEEKNTKVVKESTESAPEEQEDSEMMKFMKLLYNTLLDNEVDEKYANQILDEIDKSNSAGKPFDFILANVYQKMILKFGQPEYVKASVNKPKLLFFVGPTGVGKTTTIAKLASKFCLEQKKKIALVTADTFRIAAAEQLRTYANILEIPFRVVYSYDEMNAYVKEFKDYDYILVDTAGHSYQNEAQRENMRELLHCLPEDIEQEVYLVLPATTKYRDLKKIADTYSDMTDYRLIFTKTDETDALGNILNMKLYTGKSISYVTYGQNVPNDIERFNPQKTVKVLLGGKK